MELKFPRKLPHLNGVTARLSATHPDSNLCIHRSAALVLDFKGSLLCFGTFRAATAEERLREPRASDVPFIHAWVEVGERAISTTLMQSDGHLPAIDRGFYYASNHARDIVRMSRGRLLQISAQTGLSEHFRHGKPLRGGVSVGGVLLDAAGVKWRTSETGSVLPKEE